MSLSRTAGDIIQTNNPLVLNPPPPPTPLLLLALTGEQQHVGIPSKTAGDKVNLEVDVLGKYVERSLSSVLDRLGAMERSLSSVLDRLVTLEDFKEVRYFLDIFRNQKVVLVRCTGGRRIK